MYTEFHTNANALDEKFLKSVKALFKSKSISIIISEEPDETKYLFQSEANKKMLLKSAKQADAGDLITVDFGKQVKRNKK